MATVSFEEEKEGQEPKKCEQLLKAGKGKKMDSHYEHPEWNIESPTNALITTH